jgi:redox-sensitive bicupin YhaK (pirin superfamily)
MTYYEMQATLSQGDKMKIEALLIDALAGTDIRIKWPVMASARYALVKALQSWEPTMEDIV